jgi:hypothetical protein
MIARQMARDLAFTMKLSKIVSHNPLKINFSCHICGDGKDSHSTRGWFYEHKGDVRYGCFNCNYNNKFSFYLKEFHPDKYREYLMERRKDEKPKEQPKEDVSKFTKVIPVIKETVIQKYAQRLDLLPDGHPAKSYMVNRMIPLDKLCLFWFTMNWRGLTNEVVPETYKFVANEPRIVIPIFNKDGSISAMQGRALRSTEKLRYVTIKADEESNKVFGLERIDYDKLGFFLEGPIDSVFIDNAVAIVGGQMGLNEVPLKKRAWVLDNEPRSRDTCRRILKLIEAGENVVLWDKCRWTSKDVNDMIQKEGATIKEVNAYFKENVVNGLAAKMRFNNWIKCKL